MKKKRLLLLSLFAVLTAGCGIALLTCCSDSSDKAPLSPTDDSSQFVTLTDAVPDAILEIRYFGT
ncbi:MAG: peptidase M15, partial [Bacteroidaceae bacterium]|nr:peptidase M15 [Bacteroidaceae bacterium]